jgi:carboxyl-terminal processing protease
VQKQTFVADAAKAIVPTAPVVVLVNRGTAGPAELVAAALMDNKRADVVGEKTFGEGAQQKTFELPDGAALILSVAKYESPSGKKLQDEGVTPGVLVASNLDEGAGADDEVGDDQAPTKVHDQTASQKPGVSVDDQLSRALEILKGKAA